jgi:hypothetical protein
MESAKKHGDPLEDEIRPPRGAEEVEDHQPGSKGRRAEEKPPIVRSAGQKPTKPDDDATTPAEADLDRRRSNM